MSKKAQIAVNAIIVILAIIWFLLDLPQIEPLITILSVIIVLFNIAIPKNKVRIQRIFNKSDVKVKNVDNTNVIITDINNSKIEIENDK